MHSETIVGVHGTMVLCLHGVCFKLSCAHVSASAESTLRYTEMVINSTLSFG